MLGDFSLSYNGHCLFGDKVRSKQLWNLLEYLLVNRNREVSSERIMQALWPDDDIEDPANALKNLVYRLRNMLKKSLHISSGDIIVYNHGTYVWNSTFPCKIDVDVLESAYESIHNNPIDAQNLRKKYNEIIKIYRGGFLPQSSYKDWVIPLAVYYQRIYMETVDKYCQLLLMEKDFSAIQEICLHAISMDPFIEINHALLIKSLIGAHNYDKALDHYNDVCKMFYDELGVKPSEIITDLYQEISQQNMGTGSDLVSIKEDLNEISDISGALYCNYDMFKMIYRLEARAAERSGKSIYIALLTVNTKEEKIIPTPNMEKAFALIKNMIMDSLRKDDIITRYGKTQFLLMLSNLTYENCNMVLDRLIKNINASYIGKDFKLLGQMQPLDHVGWGDIDA